MRSGSLSRFRLSKKSLISPPRYGKYPSRNSRNMISLRCARARKDCALLSASAFLGPLAASTTHCTSAPGFSSSSLRTVPPQPISMSSLCAPRQRIRRRSRRPERARLSIVRLACGIRAAGAGTFPHHPRSVALVEQVGQFLMFLEGVHAPELIGPVAHELLFGYEPLEGLHDQLFARLDVVENLLPEREESGVDEEVGLAHSRNGAHRIVGIERDHVKALGRLGAQEAGDLSAAHEAIDLVGKGEAAQSVGVVRQENLFAFQVLFDRLQPLSDVGLQARIDERDAPIRDVAALQLNFLAAACHGEVV